MVNSVKSTSLTYYPNPLTDEGAHVVIARPGESVADVVYRIASPVSEPTVLYNGVQLKQDLWQAIRLHETDRMAIRAVARGFLGGGGGGGGGSNPVAAVLTIGVLIAAPYLAGVAASGGLAAALGVTSTAGVAALTAGLTSVIGTAGMLVVNAVFPPRLPNVMMGGGGVGGAGTPAQQFAISGGSNRARPYEALTLVLGRHKLYPDLAGIPYSEYENADQFLGQMFDCGVGNLILSEYRIGDGLLSDYDGVQTSRASPVTLVHGNVDTGAGGELEAGMSVTRTTAMDTTRIGIDIVSQFFTIGDDGELIGHSMVFTIEHRVSGSSSTWISRTVTLLSPSSIEARNLLRRSIYIGVARGQYDVRVTRTTAEDTGTRATQVSAWGALRSYQRDTTDWTGRNPLALRVRATGQLTGTIAEFSVIAEQRVQTWNGIAWGLAGSERPSSNPAAILRAYWLGIPIGLQERVAGMYLPSVRIDHRTLGEWYEFCDLFGLTCDLVLQPPGDHESVMRVIAQCGWATIDRQAGIWSVIWENGGEPVSAVITPANIVAGSLAVTYDNQALADEVIGDYIDASAGYRPNTLRRTTVAGATPARPVQVTLDGVTDGAAAAMEINRTAAAQVYHTRTIVWEMPAEGLDLRRGRVIAMAHDLVGGSLGGRLVDISSNRREVRMSPPLAMGSGALWIWDLNDNVLALLYTVATDGSPAILSDELPEPHAGLDDSPLSYRWISFDPNGSVAQVRITGLESGGSGGVIRVSARDEIPAYYTARTADLTRPLLPSISDRLLPPTLTAVTLPDGVRRFAWIGFGQTGITRGFELRYSADLRASWGEMIPLHEGLLRSSPYETHEPFSGTWRIAIREALLSGLYGPIAMATITFGPSPRGRGVNWTGPWVIGKVYEEQDGVSHTSRSYVAKQGHTSSAENAPSGTSEANDFWDLLADRGVDGRQGIDGDPGRDGVRGPALFGVPISAGQQNILRQLGSTSNLPAQFVALADAATIDDNVIGDFVSFYRGSFAQAWSWSGIIWAFAPRFIAAQLIAANSLSAITATIGTFRSSASGQRVEIRDNSLRVYDSSNRLRVEIGQLS